MKRLVVLLVILPFLCCGSVDNTAPVSDRSASYIEEHGKLPGVDLFLPPALTELHAHLEKAEEMEAPDSEWMAENIRLETLVALEYRIYLGRTLLDSTKENEMRQQIQQKLQELKKQHDLICSEGR